MMGQLSICEMRPAAELITLFITVVQVPAALGKI